jgi:hypothetical protein
MKPAAAVKQNLLTFHELFKVKTTAMRIAPRAA